MLRLASAPALAVLALSGLLATATAPPGAQGEPVRHTPVVRPHGPVLPEPRRAARQTLPLPPPLPESEQPVPAVAAAKPASKPAPAKPEEEKKPGLPVPRFASLRTDDVNMRAGPGFRYPIAWIYKRRELPVEIERDFEVWRLIQTPDGTRGWVHEATLTGRRTFIVQDPEVTVRAEPRDDAAAVARLKSGVIGRIRYCHKDSDWCRVQVREYAGFLKRTELWGILPGEVIPAP